ncbi:MAG: hypothetical protein FWF10_07355 [Clostridiales bacterium]|nr:hypothetical protein [Clostridiales bacterium]
MNIEKIKTADIQDLLRGYTKQKKYSCLWCNKTFTSETEMQAHLNAAHTPESRFHTLLNADSLFHFSTLEYLVYEAMFRGQDAGAISAELCQSPSSVRGARQNFYTRVAQAKALLMLHELLSERQSPLRKYNKASSPKSPQGQNIAVDDNNCVNEFYNITELHGQPIRHATCLILLTQPCDDGSLRFLCVDKARKNGGGSGPLFLWDCAGAHLSVSDLSLPADKAICTELAPKHFRNAALRDLTETLRIPHTAIDADRLTYLFTTAYKGASAYGINHEITDVFVYRLPEAAKNVKLYDQYSDSLGETVKKQFRTKYFSYEELQTEHREKRMMDGLSRIMDVFANQAEQLERLTRLCEEGT